MSFVAVAIGGSALLGAGVSFMGSSSAAKDQKSAEKRQARRLYAASSEVEGYADEYVNFLDKLETDFDPYDVEDAFNSLYEAIIQPMERDFDENVLPGIQAAYSGGVMGGGAGLSGAASAAESGARRDLSEKKAELQYQERGQAISRNYMDFAQSSQTAAQKLQARSMAPNMRAGIATQLYGAETDTIAAGLASTQNLASGIQGVGSAIGQGLQYRAQNQRSNDLMDILKKDNR